ncbi:TauD/TfdA family dioxygenase [Limibacillus sp. MBR-115]|uniref:TauD/TfdA family dioxygenase n=1 Tax=Limibacillus sp. MBR-115 TaxID=3156465 RepID=UPI0033967DDE
MTATVAMAAEVGPGVWFGPEMAGRGDWIVEVTTEQIMAFESAIEILRHAGKELQDTDFSEVPKFPEFQRAAEEVLTGRGFILLRGLPVERWDRETTAWVYWMLGLYFGIPVPQNGDGHLLGHVKNLGKDYRDPAVRIYQTNYRQPFHTDSCDIVGLLCLRPAKQGGESRIVSSSTLHNEMLARRPDLLNVLYEPFVLDRKNEVPEGKGPYYEIPVFHRYGDRITGFYARDFIEAAQQRFAEIPRLTNRQIEALDYLDSLANDPSLYLAMDFQPGDVQLLHNHQILHARAAYEDWSEVERRRHLLRLWLSTPNGRALPPVFCERYGTVTPGEIRGGIRVPGVIPQVILDV